MAVKTPGIYFQEIDNTQYTNPKSVTGTTVCVVGFARKGPIGVPVTITSLNSFLSTFGNGIEGYYSALAVKNVLAAGGRIIFVRVADDTATCSNVVIKNGNKKINGRTYFDKGTDILKETKDFHNQSIYSLIVTNAEKDSSKQFFVRTPKAGKLSQASVFEQISNQAINATPASYEALHRGETVSGVFSFDLHRDGTKKNNQPYFIETVEGESTELFATSLRNALVKSPNMTTSLEITDSLTKEGSNNINGDTPLSKLSGDFTFTLNELTIQVTNVSNLTVKGLAKKIDDATKLHNIRCIFSDSEDTPKFIFIKQAGLDLENTIEIKSAITGRALFYKAKDAEELSEFTADPSEEETTSNGFVVKGIVKSSNTDEAINDIEVKYNKDTESISLINNNSNENKIELKASADGDFVFGSECGFVSRDAESLKDNIFIISKQDALKGVKIIRDAESRKIYFESEDNITFPKLNRQEDEAIVTAVTTVTKALISGKAYELLDLEKNLNDINSTGFTEIEGKEAIEDSKRDMIIISSKEKGTETNNIAVELYGSKSPIDKEKIKYDLFISVNGELRETYEDVSLNSDDHENCFVDLIMREEDNGGSKYIEILVEKNNTTSPLIEFKPGTYYVGKPNTPDSKKRMENIPVEEYKNYDYSVGTDGISEDDLLFMDAMDKVESPLADEQLYNFHILIHPDNHNEDVQNAAIALCEERKDSFTIVDPPEGLSKKAVIDWHNGTGSYGRGTPLESNYAATYWPWCKVYDSAAKQQIWVMPSVIMAAQYVRVDKTAGSWYAPAGETNGILPIADIEKYPNKIDRGELYLDFNRINPIIKVENDNFIVFGEKTLQRNNSILTKIHARRMMIEIKKQIRVILRPYIFMPNTSEYLPKINSKITAILERFKVGGGLDSYRVVCDETNNTSATRQQDIINVSVAIVPNGTIEEVNITFNINKTDQEVTTD